MYFSRLIAAGVAASLLSGCVHAEIANVPPQIRPADDEVLAKVLHAKGTQTYTCRANVGSAGYGWVFLAPAATLYDERGHEIGIHGAGPVWEARDGSRVVGQEKQRVSAPKTGDIPWLHLTAVSTTASGMFGQTSSVLRINTSGGVAPTTGCEKATLGTVARIDYSADYYLYTKRRGFAM